MPPKSSSRDKNKKLTDFFAQAPRSTSAPVVAGPTGTTTETISAARRRPTTRASKVIIDRESFKNSGAPPQIRSVSTMSTRKRARSPDANNYVASPFPSAKRRSPRVSVEVAQLDDVDASPLLTSHNSLAQRSTSIQSHNSILIASPADSSKQIVYSSQSDEVELVLPDPVSRNLENVVGVHIWRRKALESLDSPILHAYEDAMDVDLAPSSSISGSPTASPRSAASVSRLDASELPPLPSTPEPMDPETKTAKIIAGIKARAFAASQSSDDEKPLSFRDLEDSDDDDITGDLPLIGSARKNDFLFSASQTTNGIFSSPLSSVPSTSNDKNGGFRTRTIQDPPVSPSRPTRMSARIHKHTSAFRPSLTVAENLTSGVTKSVSFSSNRKKPWGMNPVHALLREKELEDKRGVSGAALRLAEEVARQNSCGVLAGSGDKLDIINQSRLTDVQAAWEAVYELRSSASPADPNNVEGFAIGNRESKILGADAGEAINKILAGDKDDRAKQEAVNADEEMTSGVLLWTQPLDEDMVVDSVSVAPLSGHHILSCLDGFLKGGDDTLVDLILRTGMLTVVPRDILLTNVPLLLITALLASSHVADAICIAFRDLWESNRKVQMPVAAVVFALARLGASPSILKELGLTTELAQSDHISREMLLEAVKRLLVIMKAAGFAGAFSSDDVPNMVLILVILGLDPFTSKELRTQVNIIMDIICNRDATLLHDIHERILHFAKRLVPGSKALLVSFFASGSGRTRCIAQRLAYSLLLSTFTVPNDQALALEPLVLLLSPDIGSCKLFDVSKGSTNFEELVHYVYILSVALIDIAPYVKEERGLTKSASASVRGGPSRGKKPSEPLLEHLRRALENLQGKIVDTRAAHLDRSRTKAALQRLTMRIYYGRMALIGGRPSRRLSTLRAYFSPQRQQT